MADAWLGISSANLDSFCGEHASYPLSDALDGNGYWVHVADEAHWFILDLGQTYTIKAVRGRSDLANDPTDVDIYVSDSKTVWGATVASGITTWQDDTNWVEIDTTDKNGRYIKVVINDTENVDRTIAFGDTPAFTIFDAYGDVAVGVTQQAVGGATMSIASSLLKQTYKPTGSGTVAIAGSLVKVPTFIRATGGASVSIAGILTGEWIKIISVSMGTVSMASTLRKSISKLVGGSMSIAGALTAYQIFVRAVGGASVAMAGTLAKIQIYVRAVGSGTISIASTLLKKTSKNIGGDMAIAGSLIKKTLKVTGSGTIAIAGSLTKFTKKLVGAGTMAIAGSFAWKRLRDVGGGTVAIAGTLTYIWRWLELTVKFYSRAKTMFMYTWRKWVVK